MYSALGIAGLLPKQQRMANKVCDYTACGEIII
jgi:hypothetical protein